MKRFLTSLAFSLIIFSLHPQDCVFMYEGKELDNGSTLIIYSKIDPLFGDPICDTRSIESPNKGLYFKNKTDNVKSGSASITIQSNTMDGESIQWIMDRYIYAIESNTKSVDITLTALSQMYVALDCEPTKEGVMLTLLEVKANGKTYTIYIKFINDSRFYNSTVYIGSKSYKYTGRSPELEYEVKEGYEAYPNSTFTLEKNAGTHSIDIPFTIVKSGKSYEEKVNYQYTILPETLNVKAQDSNRLYGDANPQIKLSYSGFVNNEDESVITTKPSIKTTATKASNVGDYPINISGGEAKNYEFVYEPGVLTVTKAPLSAIVNDATKVYGDQNPAFTIEYFGLKNDESTPTWTTRPSLLTEATKNSGVGKYEVKAVNGVPVNYDLEEIAAGTLTVTPAPLTIKANDAVRPYYSKEPSFSYTCSGFVNNDDENVLSSAPALSTSAVITSNAGSYEIKISGASSQNYSISNINGTLTITPRTLIASVGNYERMYNEDNPNFEVKYDGFVGNEDETVLKTQAIASTSATKESDTGTYIINVTGGYSDNYKFSYTNGLLTINKAYQTITWEQEFGNVNQYEQIELKAEASSGLDITYSIEGDNLGNITKIGKKQFLDCFGTGEAVVVAVQKGNKNYWQTTKMYKPIKIIPTAVSDLTAKSNDVQAIYDINGRELTKTQRGVNILLMRDGSKRKLVVK